MIKYRYIRTEDNVPVATIATEKIENDLVKVALSRCHDGDDFEKIMGRHIARERLKKGTEEQWCWLHFGEDYQYGTTPEDEGNALISLLQGHCVGIKLHNLKSFLEEVSRVVLSTELRCKLIRSQYQPVSFTNSIVSFKPSRIREVVAALRE